MDANVQGCPEVTKTIYLANPYGFSAQQKMMLLPPIVAALEELELVSPVGGRAPAEADRGDGPVRLTAADFDIDVTARRAAVCPAGHEAVSEYEDEDAPERVEMHFAREVSPARCVPGVL